MISINSRLKNKIVKNPEIEDLIVFGSLMRGKERPNDIDVLVLFKTKVDKEVEYEIRKELEKKYSNISIISKNIENLYDKSFDAREGTLFEGKSLLTNELIAEKYGFSSYAMFRYDFKDWNKLKKTKFYHALNGRNGNSGILDSLDSFKLSEGIILTPLPQIEKMREFLESWEIEYKYIPMMIPERLGKKRILVG